MHNLAKVFGPKIPVLSFLLSFVVAWLLLPISHGLPIVPFVILFICLSTLVYFLRKDRSWFDTILYLGILGLSTFLLFRVNEVIQLINFLFVVLFGSLLILPLAREHKLPNLLLTPFYMINESLTGKSIFPYSWSFLKKYNKTGHLKGYLPSIVMTVLFLGITIPLLASANPFFNRLIQNTLEFFDLAHLVPFFRADQLVYYMARLIIFTFLAYVIPRVLTASSEGVKRNEITLSLPVNYLIPKVAMGILLVIFFITQMQLYFATPDVLRSMGYTNSRLTNEVFFQVTIVAFIIFFLTYLDKNRNIWNKRLAYFLILEAFFLVGIAFKSVFDYSYLWGFTQKRLWGYATMTWLSGALLFFVYYYIKQFPLLSFFRQIIVYTIAVLLGINIANFDYLIAHHSKARTQSGTDYVYLTNLSPDALYYKETLSSLVGQIEGSTAQEHEKIIAAYRVLEKIEWLKKKYSHNTPVNSFNFSEYQEYSNVKDINTQEYRIRLSGVQQKYNSSEKNSSQQRSMNTRTR